ncbi:hypothetical protein ACFL0X_00300 [Nanoarchaeota archaeon]
MPTGITTMINSEEDVSFKDFALRCARSMSALISMRDEPIDAKIPTEFKHSSYHKDEFAEACKEFYGAMVMRNDEAERLAEKSYVKELEYYAQSEDDGRKLAVKYGKMLAKVANWQSPSPEHDNYRKFMISQLEDSLGYDCEHNRNVPKQMTALEYRTTLVESARWKMNYHKKEFAKEVKHAKAKTKWVQGLMDSLPEEA